MSSSLLQLVRDTDAQYRQQQQQQYQQQLYLQRNSSVQPSSPTTSNPFPVHNTSILSLSPLPHSPTHSHSHLSPRSLQHSAMEDDWVGGYRGYKMRVKAAFDENMRRMEVRMEERMEEVREEVRAEMQREVRRLTSRGGGKSSREEEQKEQMGGRDDETTREEVVRLREQVRDLKRRMVQVMVREESREKQADDTQHVLHQLLGQPDSLTADLSTTLSAVRQDVAAQQSQLDRLDRQLAQLSHTTSSSPLTLHAASNTLGAAASAVWPSGLTIEATATASQTLSTRFTRLETELTSVTHSLNDQVATMASSLSSLTASTSSLLSTSLQPIRAALKPLQALGDEMAAVQRRLTVAEEEGRRARVRQEEDWAMLRQWMDKMRDERDSRRSDRRAATTALDQPAGSGRDEEIERSKLRWKWIEDERRDKEREDKREREDRQRSLADDRHAHSQQLNQLVEEARDGVKRAIREQCEGWERKVREVVREEWRREREDGKHDAMRLTLERVERRLDEEGECYRHVSNEVRDVKDVFYQFKQQVNAQLTEVRASAQRNVSAAATVASSLPPQTFNIHTSSPPPFPTSASPVFSTTAAPAPAVFPPTSAAATAAGVSELLAVMRAQGLLPSHITATPATYPIQGQPSASLAASATTIPHTSSSADPASLPPAFSVAAALNASVSAAANSGASVPTAPSGTTTSQHSSITAFSKPLDMTDVLTGRPAQPSPTTSSPPSSRTSRHASLSALNATDALTFAAQQQRDKASQEERVRQATLAVEQRIAAEQAKAVEDERRRREADDKLQAEQQQAKQRAALEQRDKEEALRAEMEEKAKAVRLRAEIEEKAKAEKRAQEEKEKTERLRLAAETEEKRRQTEKAQAEAAAAAVAQRVKSAAPPAAAPFTVPVAAAIPSSAPWLQEDSAELSVLARNLPIVARSEKRTTISLVVTPLPSSAHLPFRSLDVTNDAQLHTAGQYDIEHTLLLAPISSFAPEVGLQCRLAVVERSRDGVDECVAVCVLDVSEVWKRKGTFFPLSVSGESSWQQQQLTSKRTSLMIKIQHATSATVNQVKEKGKMRADGSDDEVGKTAVSGSGIGSKQVAASSSLAPLPLVSASAAALPAIIRSTPAATSTALSKLDKPPTIPSTNSSTSALSSSPFASSPSSSSPSSSPSSSFTVKNSSASPSQTFNPPSAQSATSRTFSFNQPPTTTVLKQGATVGKAGDSSSSSEDESEDEVEVTRSTVQVVTDNKPTTSVAQRSLLSPTRAPQHVQPSPSSTILSAMRQTASPAPAPAPVTVAKPAAPVRAASDSDESSSEDDDDTPAPAPVSRRAATVGITVRAVPRPAPAPTPAAITASAESKEADPSANTKPTSSVPASKPAAIVQPTTTTTTTSTTTTTVPKPTMPPSTPALSSPLSAVTGKQQQQAEDSKPSSQLPAPLSRPAFAPASSFLASLRGLPPTVSSSARPPAAVTSMAAGRAPALGGSARELSDDELSIEANDDEGADLELDFDDDEERF